MQRMFTCALALLGTVGQCHGWHCCSSASDNVSVPWWKCRGRIQQRFLSFLHGFCSSHSDLNHDRPFWSFMWTPRVFTGVHGEQTWKILWTYLVSVTSPDVSSVLPLPLGLHQFVSYSSWTFCWHLVLSIPGECMFMYSLSLQSPSLLRFWTSSLQPPFSDGFEKYCEFEVSLALFHY